MPTLLTEKITLQDGTSRDIPALRDGNPVVRGDDGQEHVVEVQHFPGLLKSRASMGELRGKSEELEQKVSSLQSELNKFGRDADARKLTLDLAGKARAFDDRKLVEAGKVEELIAERTAKMLEDHKAEIADRETKIQQRDQVIERAVIDSKFEGITGAGRPFDSTEGWSLTASPVKALFRPHFRVENGSEVAYERLPGTNGPEDPGKKVFNAHGEPASFDEAVSILRDKHPEKDHWRRSKASGAGAPGGAAGNNGQKAYSRSEFDKLPPTKQMEHIQAGGGVTDG